MQGSRVQRKIMGKQYRNKREKRERVVPRGVPRVTWQMARADRH